MKKKKSKDQIPTSIDLWDSIRKDWNGINPISRIEESKKRKPVKHKKREMEKASEI